MLPIIRDFRNPKRAAKIDKIKDVLLAASCSSKRARTASTPLFSTDSGRVESDSTDSASAFAATSSMPSGSTLEIRKVMSARVAFSASQAPKRTTSFAPSRSSRKKSAIFARSSISASIPRAASARRK
jgi:hypothetical protein